MSKPKVIIVGKLPPPYIGPAVATKILLDSSLSNEFELLHLNTTINKTVEDFGKAGFSKVLKNLAVYFRLIKMLAKEKPALILIPISQTTLGFAKDAVFIWLSSCFSTKILLQLRGSNYKNWMKASSRITKLWVKKSLQRGDGMIVLGNNLKHLFEVVFSIEKIHVVPNGCDLEIPKSTHLNQTVKLLYFANFLPQKGIKQVLKAVLLLKQKGLQNFTLEAVGAWDNQAYQNECESLVLEHQLPVVFHSPMSGEAKWEMFAQADLFVFVPNLPEGHPWVIVEALAAGLPIVSSDQGAIVESVLDGENGFIVDPKSPEEIANAITQLLKQENLRKSMGEKSKQHYLNNFTEQKMVAHLSSAIKACIVS